MGWINFFRWQTATPKCCWGPGWSSEVTRSLVFSCLWFLWCPVFGAVVILWTASKQILFLFHSTLLIKSTADMLKPSKENLVPSHMPDFHLFNISDHILLLLWSFNPDTYQVLFIPYMTCQAGVLTWSYSQSELLCSCFWFQIWLF